MIRKVNNCVSCGFPCIGKSCAFRESIEKICDKCKEYVEDLYWVDGEQYCASCALEEFEKVEVDEDVDY